MEKSYPKIKPLAFTHSTHTHADPRNAHLEKNTPKVLTVIYNSKFKIRLLTEEFK